MKFKLKINLKYLWNHNRVNITTNMWTEEYIFPFQKSTSTITAASGELKCLAFCALKNKNLNTTSKDMFYLSWVFLSFNSMTVPIFFTDFNNQYLINLIFWTIVFITILIILHNKFQNSLKILIFSPLFCISFCYFLPNLRLQIVSIWADAGQ